MDGHKIVERGASIVELALVLPLLFLILAGIADLGRAFHDYIIISNASREGARYASHFPNAQDSSVLTGIKNAAINEAAYTGITISPTLVTVDPLTLSITAKGVPITVTVQYRFKMILSRIIGMDAITMTVRTRMVVFGYD